MPALMRQARGLRTEEAINATRQARSAFLEKLMENYPGVDPMTLAMQAYASAFVDLLTASAQSRHAAVLINAANAELWAAGLQVVRVGS